MKTLGIFSGQPKYAVRARLQSRISFDDTQPLAGARQSCMLSGWQVTCFTIQVKGKQAALCNRKH
jgi:hypothetical protein